MKELEQTWFWCFFFFFFDREENVLISTKSTQEYTGYIKSALGKKIGKREHTKNTPPLIQAPTNLCNRLYMYTHRLYTP